MKKISFSIALIVCTLFFYVSSSAQTSKKRVAVPESPPDRIALDKKQPDKQVDTLRAARPIEVPPFATDSANLQPCKLTKDADYIGGLGKLVEFLQDNLEYPDDEMEYGFQGKVIVGFIVNENGELSHHRIVQTAGAPFDREALRVTRKISSFSPAMCGDTPTKSYYTLPITFTLEEDYSGEYRSEYLIDESTPYIRFVPTEPHDEYARIFYGVGFNNEMYKICVALPSKEQTVYLGVMLTVNEDGTYSNPQVVSNSANLNPSEIAAVLKKLPKATPAYDYGKPVPAHVFVGFTNDERSLKALQGN
ncbi:MAG: hypothetical protein RL660_805 [Bacteroidota bacterium]|jgi:TonB family protein